MDTLKMFKTPLVVVALVFALAFFGSVFFSSCFGPTPNKFLAAGTGLGVILVSVAIRDLIL